MRLMAKFAACLLVAVIVILALDAYVRVRRAVARSDRDVRGHAQSMARAMAPLVREVWRTHGPEYALKLIEQADDKHDAIQVRWVWLDSTARDGPHCARGGAERVKKAMGKDTVSLKVADKGGNEHLCTYVPVDVDAGRRGAIELCEPLSFVSEYVRQTVVYKATLAGILALATAVAVLVLGLVLVARPLSQLIDKTRRVGAGDLSGPVRLGSRDELAELGEALNEMCEKLAGAQDRVRAEIDARIGTVEQLRHADRLATVGRLASGIAHELGTPLNVVLARAGMIARGDLQPSEAASNADIIRGQTERMTRTIRQLLTFARPRRPRKAVTDLTALVRQTLELVEPLAQKRDVHLSVTDGEASAMAQVDGAQIQQVLTNLIDNAISAGGAQGKVELGIRTELTRPPGSPEGDREEYVCVHVRDDGEGIPEESIPHLFEPFFTTKDVGEGTGLGLSVAYGIVSEHGGWIEVESRPGNGSCFSVHLPVGEKEC